MTYQHKDTGLKVLMLPDYTRINPYQENLVAALKDNKVVVQLSKAKNLNRIAYNSLLSKHKPDILHLHWIHGFILGRNNIISLFKTFCFCIDLIILKLSGVRIVWTVHNLVHHESHLATLERIANVICVRLYDRIIVHCNFARVALAKQCFAGRGIIRKTSILPHGHYIDTYPNTKTRKESRQILRLNEEHIVFMFFGLIRPYKGVFKLMEIFKMLKEDSARLLIAGKPSNDGIRETVLEFASSDKRIQTVLEFVEDGDIQVYMNAADVIVLPFERTLTSGSALLAMSFAKALIMPNLGCLSEVADDKGCIFFDSGDDKGLLNSMKYALRSDLQGMGKHNYALAESFRWPDIAEKTVHVYRARKTLRM